MGMRARFASADHIRSCGSFDGNTEGRVKAKAWSKGGRGESHSFVSGIFMGAVVICFWVVLHRSPSPSADHYEDRHPTITIFSAPMPLSSSSGTMEMVKERQELAVRSWLAVSPDISVVLFGQHPSILAFAEAFGPRVSVETGIDFTFLGTPFFHSMVHKMKSYNSDISVLIDPEVLIFPDTITALHTAYNLETDWLLISASQKVLKFPFHLDNTGRYWLNKDGESITLNKAFLEGCKHQSNYSRNLFAWNKGTVPLHAGVLPPFLYGKGLHDSWLISESISSGFRLVIDASEAIENIYPESLDSLSRKMPAEPAKEDGNRSLWENNCNSYLASTYGSLCFQSNMDSNSVVQLVRCGGRYTFINTTRSRSIVPKVQKKVGPMMRDLLLSFIAKRWRYSLEDCYWSRSKNFLPNVSMSGLQMTLQLTSPFSLKSLVELVADEHQTVVLTIAGESYKDMLMSWVCRLRRLSIRNFLVFALDMETYQFSVLQGLPVFMDELAPRNISFNSCHFGSDCFQRVTKVKSRLVLQILKLGYSVLLSDVDVFWFRNPLPYLRSFGPAILAAQSDEYNETGPINLPRRLNSGFYFAQSDLPTILAIEKVVKHALVSGLSEQPSFYDVLCGEKGVNRVGNDRCLEPETNLTVHFLDRNLFPNGAFLGLWEKRHVWSACRKKQSMILHNNWISGRQRKLERQVRSGLFAYSSTSRTCIRSFHRGRELNKLL